MPDHVQQQILDAVAATLVAAGTVAAGRVFVDRADPLQASELPALQVDELPDGDVVEQQMVDSAYQRRLVLRVTAVVSTGVAAARALGLQVEKALAANPLLGGLAAGGISLQASRPTVSQDADRLLALRELDYSAQWFANAATPDVAI